MEQFFVATFSGVHREGVKLAAVATNFAVCHSACCERVSGVTPLSSTTPSTLSVSKLVSRA